MYKRQPLHIAARRPLAALDRFAVSCADAEIAPHPGSLASPPEIPRGWRVNRHEVVVGEGREAYRRLHLHTLLFQCPVQ